MFRQFFQHKILTASLILIAMTGMSLYSWFAIPIEVLPSENSKALLFLRVNAKDRSTPELNELTLTKPLEGVVRTLPALLNLQTTTDTAGSSLTMEFRPDADIDHATQLLQQSLQGLSTELGFRMDNVSFSRSNPESESVIRFSVKIPSEYSLKKIRDEIRTEFESVEGVSKIEWAGTEPATHLFEVPYSRLRNFAIEPSDFQSRLKLPEFVDNLGDLVDRYSQIPVSMFQSSSNLKDFANLTLVRGQFVPISLLASEKIIRKQEQDILQLNGSPSYFLDVFAKERANLFKLKSRLLEKMSWMASVKAFSQVEFQKVLDRVEDLELALADVFSSLYQALLITLVVVFLFLRDFKTTFIVSITIPVTVLYTILLLLMKGTSLNLLTLSGLILCIGMVIDNAILVVDRMMEIKDESELGARVGRAVDEVLPSLVVSSLTNALIFIPVLFIESGDEFILILKSFIVPIAGSLAASVLIAGLLVPLCAYFLKIKSSDSKKRDFFAEKSEPFFRMVPKHSRLILVLSILFVLFVFDRVKKVETAGLGQAPEPSISMRVKFENQMSSEEKKTEFLRVQKELLSAKENIKFSHVISEFSPLFKEGVMSIFPDISAGEERDDSRQNLEAKLIRWVNGLKLGPGAQLFVGDNAPANFKYAPSLQFQFSSESMIQAKGVVQAVIDNLKSNGAVEEVYFNRSEYTSPEGLLIPKAAYYQLDPADRKKALMSFQALLAQRQFEDLKTDSEPVTAKAKIIGAHTPWLLEEYLRTPVSVGALEFYVGGLFDWQKNFPISSILRRESQTVSNLKIQFRMNADKDSRNAVNNSVKTMEFPPGMGFAKDTRFEKIEQMAKNTNFIILLSCFLIYVFLASQFQSYFAPFAILFTVPLALLFGVFGLWIGGYELDVMARLSLVLLVGGGVNSAILLIEIIRELRGQGLNRLEAIAVGCSRRLRAVLMTTLIQILSVLPVVFGNAKMMGLPYKTLGLVMVSGLFFSTILTLILLPMAYLGFDLLEEKVMGKSRFDRGT